MHNQHFPRRRNFVHKINWGSTLCQLHARDTNISACASHRSMHATIDYWGNREYESLYDNDNASSGVAGSICLRKRDRFGDDLGRRGTRFESREAAAVVLISPGRSTCLRKNDPVSDGLGRRGTVSAAAASMQMTKPARRQNSSVSFPDLSIPNPLPVWMVWERDSILIGLHIIDLPTRSCYTNWITYCLGTCTMLMTHESLQISLH